MRWLKVAVFSAALIPFALLLWGVYTEDLGADPIRRVTHTTGEWGFRFLLITLAITPLRQLTGWARLVLLRRMLGLFCFFYVSLHFLTYLALDLRFDWGHIAEDIVKRPYITVGFAAFLMLIPLAVTSTRGWQKRLGRRWKKLHRLVYPVGILAALHFAWLVKADYAEPLIYAGILTVLLVFRLVYKPKARRQPPAGRGPGHDHSSAPADGR